MQVPARAHSVGLFGDGWAGQTTQETEPCRAEVGGEGPRLAVSGGRPVAGISRQFSRDDEFSGMNLDLMGWLDLTGMASVKWEESTGNTFQKISYWHKTS